MSLPKRLRQVWQISGVIGLVGSQLRHNGQYSPFLLIIPLQQVMKCTKVPIVMRTQILIYLCHVMIDVVPLQTVNSSMD